MNKIFNVNVNQSLDFKLSLKQAEQIDVVKQNSSTYHILNNNKAVKAELIHKDFDKKSYLLRVNSNTYQVKIENSLDLLIKKIGYSTGSTKKLNFIYAPMPGIIIDLKVKEGDQIKEGDSLLILEAMKMENAITSSKDAVVKSVLVKKGDTVDKNKLLIELE